jgi:hypothetical protein
MHLKTDELPKQENNDLCCISSQSPACIAAELEEQQRI